MSDSTSGGVNLTANSNTIGGDVTGRDKIVQITTNNYYGGADGLSRELLRAPSPQPLRVLAVIASPVAGLIDTAPPPGHLSGRAEWARLREAASVAPMLLAAGVWILAWWPFARRRSSPVAAGVPA